MPNPGLKWAVLLLCLVLAPVAVLTYLSVRSFRDEQRSALADLRQLVPLLQQDFGRVLDERSAAALKTLDRGFSPEALEGTETVQQAFLLDGAGRFLYPRVLSLAAAARSPAFAAALHQAEDLEWAGDWTTAARGYRAALAAATTPAERAESLNALSRCAAKTDDLQAVEKLHERLKAHAQTLDADGAHPLTLSYLRLARRLTGEARLVLLEQWAAAVLAGAYPLYPGCRYALEQVRALANGPAAVALEAALERIGRQIDLVEAYDGLLDAGLGGGDQVLLAGRGPGGSSMLVRLGLLDDGTTLGLSFDLEALAAYVLRAPAGAQLQARGFALAVFDVQQSAAFARQHRRAVHLIAPAGPAAYRFNLGIHARSEPFVLENYRNRNFWMLSGIFGLAGTVALGVYTLYRETTRQVQTARLRAEFVSNVSHELRTPLAAVRLYAETLLLGRYNGPEQLQEYLRTILHESQRLGRMVGNILDFSRMESGRKTYQFEDCDLGQIAAAVLEEFKPVLDEEGFALHSQIPTDLPRMRADRESIASAVANLLTNALKFAAAQKEIGLRVGYGQGEHWVEVADRGIGVPEGERAEIFAKFHRAANAGGVAGTGLGLALVKGIAQAHGGRVEYAPRPDGGSLFRLVLPADRS